MIDSITWALNANASQVRAEMNSAVKSVNDATGGMTNSLWQATNAHDSLLKSNARVGHQIANVAHSFISGADAGNIFATSLEAVGRSLKLGLGSIAGLFVGGLIVGEIAKAAQAAQKLRSEIAELTAPSPDARFDTLDKLISKLEKVREKTKEVHGQGFWAGMGALFQWEDPDINSDGTWSKDANRPANQRTSALDAEAQRLMKGIAENRRRRNNENEAGGLAGERMKAYDEMLPKVKAAFFEKNLALAAEELRAFALTIKRINEKEQDRILLSLADIAENSPGYTEGGTIQTVYARDQARKVIAMRAQAHQQSLHGDLEGAGRTTALADQIQNAIPGLKSSEHIEVFRSALDTSERLREIAQKVTFTNQ